MNTKILDNTIFENIRESNHIFKKHFHESYAIDITHAGLCKSTNLNITESFYTKSIKIINPGEMHFASSCSWDYTNFYPSVELLSSLYEDIYGYKKVPIFEKYIINDIKLYSLLQTFFNCVYGNTSKMQIYTFLIDTLSYLIINYSDSCGNIENANNSKIILGSKEYINDLIETNISLDDLAINSSLSKYHYLRTFKKHTGLTPHQYILSTKVSRVRDLIIKGHSVSSASFDYGFSDQSHFIRTFKAIYGYSPNNLLSNSNFVLYK